MSRFSLLAALVARFMQPLKPNPHLLGSQKPSVNPHPKKGRLFSASMSVTVGLVAVDNRIRAKISWSTISSTADFKVSSLPESSITSTISNFLEFIPPFSLSLNILASTPISTSWKTLPLFTTAILMVSSSIPR